jgi:OmpA-OmpF porin, OOP family
MTSWYGVFEGGGTFTPPVDIQSFATPVPVTTTGRLHEELGWAVFAGLGYSYDNNWRMELEGGYRHSDFNKYRPQGGAVAPIDGEFEHFTLMANALYDFTSPGGAMLSIGAGVGADYGRMKTNAFVPGYEGDDISLAFQAIVGLSAPVTSWLDLALTYRYLYVTDLDLADDKVIAPSVAHVIPDDLQNHTLTLGFRVGSRDSEPVIAETPALPPPPAPPPVARQFIIFFGFNKCAVTSNADAVLTEAATAARTLGTAMIQISGHTDTVGSRVANQRLSECRANAAKSNLVGKGIPAGSITATGHGEDSLLIQTTDGVKEPQNRRATVDLN